VNVQGIEWAVIAGIIALLLFLGPKKIPELAKGLGRAFGEFRRGRDEIRKEVEGLVPEK